MVTQAWSTFTPFTEGGRLVSIISSMLLLLVGKFTVALYQFWQEAFKGLADLLVVLMLDHLLNGPDDD